MTQNVESDTFQDWSVSLSDFIRNNDQSLMDSADKILSFYEEEVLPCSSFAEFCDVLSLHEIPDPQDFFSNSILR
jgi:E3 ubiquitin-protein ligase UBR4